MNTATAGRPRIFLTHGPQALANYYGPHALAALQALGEVRHNPSDDDLSPDQLAELARGCDIVVSFRAHPGHADLLRQLPELKAFCRCAIDIRNVDVPVASSLGILVTQASAGFLTSVSEWIIGAMIDLSRGITLATLAYRDGKTIRPAMGRELRGSTLGLIGFGQISRTLAPLARALGMTVLIHDPYAGFGEADGRNVTLSELLAEADYVVPLAVATEATENLMDAAAFAAMKPGAFFVNASRGNLVDEDALLEALDSGRLAGCALDVGRALDQQPAMRLARHPLVVATPHVAGLTRPATEHQAMDTVRQVADILQGRVPTGAVNAGDASRLRRGNHPARAQ
jgi:D-3-phosphoglycerate dehydrogenase / 2-oxoglutarate reductase